MFSVRSERAAERWQEVRFERVLRMGQIFVAMLGEFVPKGADSCKPLAMERLANFSDEVKEEWSSVRVEEERVERSGLIVNSLRMKEGREDGNVV